jgi:hypothetical protein
VSPSLYSLSVGLPEERGRMRGKQRSKVTRWIPLPPLLEARGILKQLKHVLLGT